LVGEHLGVIMKGGI